MAQESNNNNHLVWIDMEMTGLFPDTDRIIEVALVVDDWNKSTHGRSGLIDKVRASTLAEAEVEAQMIAFLEPLVGKGKSPMCGNSICQDRRFLARHMPALEAYFHYRNLDVSTFKELVKRWKPAIAGGVTKEGKHTALADIYESIAELKYYREHFIKP
jgi:oligoribonuclease